MLFKQIVINADVAYVLKGLETDTLRTGQLNDQV